MAHQCDTLPPFRWWFGVGGGVPGVGAGSNSGGEFILAKANGVGEGRTFRDRVLAGGAGGRGEGLMRSNLMTGTGLSRIGRLLYVGWSGGGRDMGMLFGMLARYL